MIFVNSISAAYASVSRGEYCVSKAGLAMARELFAVRLAEAGIGVYEVRPGMMETDMTRAVKEKYDALIGEGLVPQGRWGTPEDVGRAVAALVSGDFDFSIRVRWWTWTAASAFCACSTEGAHRHAPMRRFHGLHASDHDRGTK